MQRVKHKETGKIVLASEYTKNKWWISETASDYVQGKGKSDFKTKYIEVVSVIEPQTNKP